MALHMDLKVNGQQIGYLQAQRLTPTRLTGNDICRYSWKLNINGVTQWNLPETPVEHRYGDGAWALVARVIEAAGRGPREEPAPMATTGHRLCGWCVAEGYACPIHAEEAANPREDTDA